MKNYEVKLKTIEKKEIILAYSIPFFAKIKNEFVGVYKEGIFETIYSSSETGTVEHAFNNNDYFNYTVEKNLSGEELIEKFEKFNRYDDIEEKDITIYTLEEYQMIREEIMQNLSCSLISIK